MRRFFAAALACAAAASMTHDEALCAVGNAKVSFFGDSLTRFCYYEFNSFLSTGELRDNFQDGDSSGDGRGAAAAREANTPRRAAAARVPRSSRRVGGGDDRGIVPRAGRRVRGGASAATDASRRPAAPAQARPTTTRRTSGTTTVSCRRRARTARIYRNRSGRRPRSFISSSTSTTTARGRRQNFSGALKMRSAWLSRNFGETRVRVKRVCVSRNFGETRVRLRR